MNFVIATGREAIRRNPLAADGIGDDVEDSGFLFFAPLIVGMNKREAAYRLATVQGFPSKYPGNFNPNN